MTRDATSSRIAVPFPCRCNFGEWRRVNVIRIRERSRYLMADFAGAEYLIMHLMCADSNKGRGRVAAQILWRCRIRFTAVTNVAGFRPGFRLMALIAGYAGSAAPIILTMAQLA